MKRIGYWLIAMTLGSIFASAAVAQQDEERITIRCRDAQLQKVILGISEFGLAAPTFDSKVRDRDVTLMLADVTPEFALDFVLEKYGLEKRAADDGGLLITGNSTRAEAPVDGAARPLLADGDDGGKIIIHHAQMAPPLGGGGGQGGGGLGGLGMGGAGAATDEEEEVEYIFEIIEAKYIGLLMLADGVIYLNADVMMGGMGGGGGGGGYGGGQGGGGFGNNGGGGGGFGNNGGGGGGFGNNGGGGGGFGNNGGGGGGNNWR